MPWEARLKIKYPGYLWEFPTEADFDAGGGYCEWMGETWGKPVITKVRLMVAGSGPVDRWVVIVTAGYHSFADPNPTDVTGLTPQSPPLPPTVYSTADPAVDPDAKKGRAIFMLDAMTGEVIAMKGYNLISADPTTIAQQEMKYAIVGRPSVLDLNADGYADIIYFVDMGGQVFKWVIAAPGQDCVNDIGAGLPTDPQVSVGAGGEDNKVIIEKSGTDIQMIEEQDIDVGSGLLYWLERF